MIMLDTADFEKEVMAEKGLVLVDFYADWCMPCKMLSPILEELSEEIDDVKIVKVNTDKNQELASSFGIMSIPTLLFVKDGKVIIHWSVCGRKRI